MHHRIMYMYVNFQQNWISRSVKTVRTNIFAKNCKLHKFATIPIIYIASVITVHTNVFAKKSQVS